MTNEVKKKKDNDWSYVLIGCGIFTVVLLIADLTYKGLGQASGWFKTLFVILHAILGILWFLVIRGIEDPNKDYLRKWLLAISIATLILVMGHRAGYISDKLFQEEVDRNKTEQP